MFTGSLCVWEKKMSSVLWFWTVFEHLNQCGTSAAKMVHTQFSGQLARWTVCVSANSYEKKTRTHPSPLVTPHRHFGLMQRSCFFLTVVTFWRKPIGATTFARAPTDAKRNNNNNNKKNLTGAEITLKQTAAHTHMGDGVWKKIGIRNTPVHKILQGEVASVLYGC